MEELNPRFIFGEQLQGSSEPHHPTYVGEESEDYTIKLSLNQNKVLVTVSNKEHTVNEWISNNVTKARINKIGIAVESDEHEMADVILLYVLGECLMYRVAGIPICDTMVNLLKSEVYTFGGKEGVRRLLKSKILSDQKGPLILNTRETLPKLHHVGAASNHNKEARELRKMSQDPYAPLSWRATRLTEAQLKMSCFDAQLGWVLIPCSAAEVELILKKLR